MIFAKIQRIIKSQRGFTLAEILIVLGASAIAMGVIMGILLPAIKTFYRYSDKEGDVTFLMYAQERIKEKITYAKVFKVLDAGSSYAEDGVSVYIKPEANGYYDIEKYFASESEEALFFKTMVRVNDENVVTVPPQLKKPEELRFKIEMTKISDKVISVSLILLRNGIVSGDVSFPVGLINCEINTADFFVPPENSGKYQVFVFR